MLFSKLNVNMWFLRIWKKLMKVQKEIVDDESKSHSHIKASFISSFCDWPIRQGRGVRWSASPLRPLRSTLPSRRCLRCHPGGGRSGGTLRWAGPAGRRRAQHPACSS